MCNLADDKLDTIFSVIYIRSILDADFGLVLLTNVYPPFSGLYNLQQSSSMNCCTMLVSFFDSSRFLSLEFHLSISGLSVQLKSPPTTTLHRSEMSVTKLSSKSSRVFWDISSE